MMQHGHTWPVNACAQLGAAPVWLPGFLSQWYASARAKVIVVLFSSMPTGFSRFPRPLPSIELRTGHGATRS